MKSSITLTTSRKDGKPTMHLEVTEPQFVGPTYKSKKLIKTGKDVTRKEALRLAQALLNFALSE